jgi:ABC-2 type transport system ATP-binding protein
VDGIEARGLEKRFGDVPALAGVDLAVAPGSVVAILGENGAGKSTLIRILATTVIPDRGSATIGGHDVVTSPLEARSALGLMLGNERSCYARLSGRQNLEFFAVIYGLPRARGRARSGELLERVGLGPHADRPFNEYSSGMRARLTLARALLREPPVLLLDEPTQSLDPVAAHDFRELIRGLAGEAGAAVLLATHDLAEAASVASAVVVLSAGTVAWSTTDPIDAAELEDRVRGVGRA